jgi:hypothetical protein
MNWEPESAQRSKLDDVLAKSLGARLLSSGGLIDPASCRPTGLFGNHYLAHRNIKTPI